MTLALDPTKRMDHFEKDFHYEDLDDFHYHLFGADKTLTGCVATSNELLYHHYRFKIEEKIIKHLIKKYCDKRNCAIDCGAGTGRVSTILDKIFKKVDAFDLSERFIKENKRRFFNNQNINFFASDFSSFESSKRKYDLVFVGGVFMYLNDEEFVSAIKKIKEAVSESGVLISRDSISREKDLSVDSLKIYRSEEKYMSFFKNDFYLMEKLNSANRNIWCSIFRRLPSFVTDRKFVLLFFMKLVDVFLMIDFLKILVLGGRRHQLAHQQFFIFKARN